MKKFLIPLLILILGCKKKDDGGGNVVTDLLFPVEYDIQLGSQLRDEINANPDQYPILDSTQYPEAYGHLYRLRDTILNTGLVVHEHDFAWELKIINDDNTLNAFAAPGGFIYVYTGLIKYLESEDELAGVMGHEMAHADRRHSVNQMIEAYGVQLLVDIVLGDNQSQLTEIAEGLVSLKNSRADESDADEYSVRYLCETEYNAAGAAGFFEKITAEGGSSVPEFLSTHPSPENRVEDINQQKTDLGCEGTVTEASYQDILNSLP